MSTSLIETIAATIVSRLSGITVAGGYNNTVDSVARPRTLAGDDVDPAHLRLVLEQDEATVNEELNKEGNGEIIAIDQAFTIVAYLLQDEASTASAIATLVNSFAADIESALCSPASWWAFGAGAIGARLEPPVPFMTADGVEGFERRLVVTIRNRVGSPYTAV